MPPQSHPLALKSDAVGLNVNQNISTSEKLYVGGNESGNK
jgi:hypothetical protein